MQAIVLQTTAPASGGNGTVRIWDAVAGHTLALMRTNSTVYACASLPDCDAIVVGALSANSDIRRLLDGEIHALDLYKEHVADRVRRYRLHPA